MSSSVCKAVVRFVVASLTLVWSSAAALQWTIHPVLHEGTNASARLYDVAFGNGRFLAIEPSGATFSAPQSRPDLWTAGPAIPDADLHRVIFARGKFAAAGQDTKTSRGLFVSSTDGTNWSRQSFENVPRITGLAYGNGSFVAVGNDFVATSTNASDWRIETNFVSQPMLFSSIHFVNGQFLATFLGNPASPYPCSKLATSTDGTNWEEHDLYCAELANQFAYGRGRYVSLGLNDCCGWISSSTDGENWRDAPFPVAFVGSAVACANGVFVISGHSHYFLSSTDGITWESFRLETAMLFHGLAFGSGRFVAVGSTWEEGRAAIAVSEFVGPVRLISNVRLNEGSLEFEFNADDKTKWQLETSEELADWNVLRDIEGTSSGVQTVIVPSRSGGPQFLRLAEKR